MRGLSSHRGIAKVTYRIGFFPQFVAIWCRYPREHTPWNHGVYVIFQENKDRKVKTPCYFRVKGVSFLEATLSGLKLRVERWWIYRNQPNFHFLQCLTDYCTRLYYLSVLLHWWWGWLWFDRECTTNNNSNTTIWIPNSPLLSRRAEKCDIQMIPTNNPTAVTANLASS